MRAFLFLGAGMIFGASGYVSAHAIHAYVRGVHWFGVLPPVMPVLMAWPLVLVMLYFATRGSK